jgi:hypothetical protein
LLFLELGLAQPFFAPLAQIRVGLLALLLRVGFSHRLDQQPNVPG